MLVKLGGVIDDHCPSLTPQGTHQGVKPNGHPSSFQSLPTGLNSLTAATTVSHKSKLFNSEGQAHLVWYLVNLQNCTWQASKKIRHEAFFKCLVSDANDIANICKCVVQTTRKQQH